MDNTEINTGCEGVVRIIGRPYQVVSITRGGIFGLGKKYIKLQDEHGSTDTISLRDYNKLAPKDETLKTGDWLYIEEKIGYNYGGCPIIERQLAALHKLPESWEFGHKVNYESCMDYYKTAQEHNIKTEGRPHTLLEMHRLA